MGRGSLQLQDTTHLILHTGLGLSLSKGCSMDLLLLQPDRDRQLTFTTLEKGQTHIRISKQTRTHMIYTQTYTAQVYEN
jgi:hypothetical protein